MERCVRRLLKIDLKKFIRDESGATAIEYALMATFIFLAIIVSVKALGTKVSAVFPKVAGNL
jgi:pilus assembly protein Flp/PilA